MIKSKSSRRPLRLCGEKSIFSQLLSSGLRPSERRRRRHAPANALIIALIALATLVAQPNPARAALAVTPVVHEICGDTAAPVAGSWCVRNPAGHAVQLTIRPIGYDDYLRGRNSALPPDWLTVEPAQLSLGPGEQATVTFSARLPASCDGETMAFVFFEEQGGGMVQGRIGTAFYLIDPATRKPDLSMVAIRLVDDGKGGRRFFMELANKGNSHVRPSGSFRIVDEEGRIAAEARLEEGMPVLARGRDRFVTESLDRVPAPGTYTVRWSLSSGTIAAIPGVLAEGSSPLVIE